MAVEEVDPGIDDLRLTRDFVGLSNANDRVQFLALLFAVALSDDFVSKEEINEIPRIARNFMLSSQTVYEAKIKIPNDKSAS